MEKAAFEVEPELRKEMYFEAQRIVNEEAAHVTLYYANTIFGVREEIEGVWIQPGGGIVIRNPKITR